MKKNTKKSLGFLALLLMIGLVASFTPGLVSADEEPAALTPEAFTVEEPATQDVRICPVTNEPCDEDCAGPVASVNEGNAEGTFYGRMNGAKVFSAVNAPVEGNVDCTPIGLGEGNMNGAVNAPGVGNVNSAPIGSATGTEDGIRTRQLLQDGTAAGGQQRVRAQDGTNCLTEIVPAG